MTTNEARVLKLEQRLGHHIELPAASGRLRGRVKGDVKWASGCSCGDSVRVVRQGGSLPLAVDEFIREAEAGVLHVE